MKRTRGWGGWAQKASVALVLSYAASSASAEEVTLNGRTFTLPPGFVMEIVAGPPLVERPITADFDEAGRLYVSESSGTNDPAQKQLEDKPHRILRLEDSDGDGKFDRRTVFADRMMFPEGTMWRDGSLYVAAPPQIWKLTDADDDGVAERREVWFDGKTLTGCANDLHGPYNGPDGWIYWCKGAFAEQTYPRPGKPPFVTRASHIFRARPDGSGIEPVMTGGMDNPVDVEFLAGGERVFTTTFLQRPGGGNRDGLIHAVYGGLYGKENDVLKDPSHKWTSPDLMPVLSHLGPAAPCGLVRYRSEAFGASYQDNLFACLFNLHKVTRHVLELDGSTYKSRDEDFVVGREVDFHPTDVIEDADGSLLIMDTGGWYKLCCPTSIFHKPDVLGAIYRVRKQFGFKRPDPRGKRIDWANARTGELIAVLDDERPVVRERAIQALATHGGDALEALQDVLRSFRLRSSESRESAVWALTRMQEPRARAAVRQALNDPNVAVKQAALFSVSVHRDALAGPQLLNVLKDESLLNRRAAAEALGRIGDASAVPALLAALSEKTDRFLEHALTYALIEIAAPEPTRAGLASSDERVHRAALVALDQMDGGVQVRDQVITDLAGGDPARRRTAAWIMGRHPEWGGALTDFFRARLADESLLPAQRAELETQLAQFAGSQPIQELLVQSLANPLASRGLLISVLRVMAQSGLREAPGAWLNELPNTLTRRDPAVLAEAVATARALVPPRDKAASQPLRTALLRIGDDPTPDAGVRLEALAAVPGGLDHVAPERMTFLLAALAPERPVPMRAAAVEVLTHAKLDAPQLKVLADALAQVGPLEADRLLAAFDRSTDEAVGLHLVAALESAPALGSLRADSLREHLKPYGPKVHEQAERLYKALNVDHEQQQAKLEQLLGSLSAGDVRRGQAVFFSTKAACSTCHAIGYVGGKIGPDLSKIGQVRAERDLLEAIAFPSATFVRSYEPVLVATKAGQVANGVIKQDGLDELVLALDANREARFARSEIEEVRPGNVSIMPAGLDQQLTHQELADLVAFLKACK